MRMNARVPRRVSRRLLKCCLPAYDSKRRVNGSCGTAALDLMGAPASATFSGPGNIAPPPPLVPAKVTKKKTVKCKKGFVKNKKGKCVRSKSKKKAKKSSANRRAKS